MISAIVTDIEGTTSSISFVKDVLFPYAREHLREFIETQGKSPDIQTLLQDARREAGVDLSDAELLNVLDRWMTEDRKITPLKSLQGYIWHDGYRKGAFSGHIYEDAATNLKKWKNQGIALYVYSSGSVSAQKLLFGHTDHGDLTSLFSGYFDTHTGAKKEIASYRHIAEIIGSPPAHILFLSDSKDELDAAAAAGFHTVGLNREQISAANTGRHPYVNSFDEISI